MANVLQHIISDLEATRELHVAFSIKGNDLIPENITKRLSINPTYSYTKGELIIPRKGIPPKQPTRRSGSLWTISTKGILNAIHVEDHFKYLLDLLEPHKEQLRDYLDKSQEYRVSIRIWRAALGDSGIVDMESSYLERICQLCHTVTLHYIGMEEV
jgi:Domain of unknown function (DUF4279)